MTTQKSEYRPPEHLDMGIWTDDGSHVWIPKEFYPTRNDAKRWALREEVVDLWIEARALTKWMRLDTELTAVQGEESYMLCMPDDVGAFEVWEIR